MPSRIKAEIILNDLAADYVAGFAVADLASKHNCSQNSIRRRLDKAGIQRPLTNKKLPGMDGEIVLAYLAGESATALGKRYGVSNVTIINTLEANGVDRRDQHDAKLQYPLDETFFDVIDSEEKAYYLGFLFADGCNHGDGLALNLTDREPVEGLRAALKTTRPIYESTNTSGNPRYALRVNSKRISDALSNKGCVPSKTIVLEFPTTEHVPIRLIHHFIRGYFDGDGCIHIRKNSSNRVVHIIGTEAFVKGMQSHLPCKSFCHQRTGKPVWFLGIYTRGGVAAFSEWLYRDATVWLERKRVKFA